MTTSESKRVRNALLLLPCACDIAPHTNACARCGGLQALDALKVVLADAKMVARYETDVAGDAIQTMKCYRAALETVLARHTPPSNAPEGNWDLVTCGIIKEALK